MSCLTCLVLWAITVIIPLKLTYDCYKNQGNMKMWAIYWGFYSFIGGFLFFISIIGAYIGVYCLVWPFYYLFPLFLVWLYHDTFKGALVIDKLVRNAIIRHEVASAKINMLASKAGFLKLFEHDQPAGKMKNL